MTGKPWLYAWVDRRISTSMYSATCDLCWKFWGVLDNLETNMTDNYTGGNRSHASSPNELSLQCNTFTSRLINRACNQHKCLCYSLLFCVSSASTNFGDWACQTPPLSPTARCNPLGHCSLLVEDLNAHVPQIFTQWVPYHQSVVMETECMTSHHRPECDGIQQLSQLGSDPMTTVSTPALDVQKCA